MTRTPLPRDFPVRPLGRNGPEYWFLTAQGQVRRLGATGLAQRANIVDLFAGVDDPEKWLTLIGPAKRDRKGGAWNADVAADTLMMACAARPLFDPETPVRGYGTWRGDGGAAVAHSGDWLHHASGVTDPAGEVIGGAIYPAAPARGQPAADAADRDDVRHILTEVAAIWGWARPTDPDAWLGWVALAMLGAFPEWRPHLWVSGRRGSGKSELIETASRLLGPMSPGVLTNASEAGLRQSANNQARPFLLDEAERKEDGGEVAKVVELVRHMAGGEGSRVLRGSAGHVAVSFSLVGAAYLSSILTADLEAQDRSRFILLSLGPIPRPDAERLYRLHKAASELGPRLWRRMLSASPRWDATWAAYRALVGRLGGDSRDGATIGAVLAGWDLALYDDAPDAERLDLAASIAAPLVADALAAAEEGEGEKCLRRLFGGLVNKDTGGMIPVYELIQRSIRDQNYKADDPDNRLLGRTGLRLWQAEPSAEPALWLVAGAHPGLDAAMRGTRWGGGGHRQALLMLDGVRPVAMPQRIGGQKVRVLQVPAKHLPGWGE